METEMVFLSTGKTMNWKTVEQGLLLSVSMSALMLTTPVAAQASAEETATTGITQNQKTYNFNIPSKTLPRAIADLSSITGLQVLYTERTTFDHTAPALKGNYVADDALAQLLEGSGLIARFTSANAVTIEKPAVSSADDKITRLRMIKLKGGKDIKVGGAERDALGHDDVYRQDVSTIYAGKVEIERYRGVSAADILKGMVGVYSGDSRNSGAIDPSIRGISGPGRVPVIIDGTEQAHTVWRGYNGSSNRSYIDPSLIAGLQIYKGPSSARNVHDSTGGAVVINTLDTDDIIEPDATFGLEFKLEGGNNSTRARLPTLLTGQDYTTVPDFPGSPGTPGNPLFAYEDPSLRVNARTPDDNEFFSQGDRAARLALAGRIGKIDLFGAYVYRTRGNYFSGTTNTDYYSQEAIADTAATKIRKLALNFEPGNEVPNTSSTTKSWLLKATWRISDEQYLQLSFRDTVSDYGEIFPSRLFSATNYGGIQWPLSKVHASAYNAEYKWVPDDNKWVDIKANLWMTRTASNAYNSGGFPNFATFDDPILRDTAIANSQNDRVGFNVSNQMEITSNLDLMIEGNWQHEKVSSKDVYGGAEEGSLAFPRAGRREEYNVKFKAEWRPVSFLKFNAGLTYSGYWAHDDFLEEQLQAGSAIGQSSIITSYDFRYQTAEFSADAFAAQQRATFESLGFPPFIIDMALPGLIQAYLQNPFPIELSHDGPHWAPDDQGNYHRADNICTNGFLDGVANYLEGSCGALSNTEIVFPDETNLHKTGQAWAPSLSVTAYLSDNSRIYLRYAEAYRFPSIFESTIGFSASINPLASLKPEHNFAYEAAFIQDLKPWLDLGEGQHADFKITYYHNTIRDIVERNRDLVFSNLDRQVTAGLELQFRYDNGRFFTDFSAGHVTKNMVCDENLAIALDISKGRIPECVKYGFVSGYLLPQATPDDSINWTLGGRFLDKRLEIGARVIYYSAYDNPQLDDFVGGEGIGENVTNNGLNIPYTWGELITFDAYALFKINDRFKAELTGTNLNDRYYADPMSRSYNPAPGRTVRLSLTGRF